MITISISQADAGVVLLFLLGLMFIIYLIGTKIGWDAGVIAGERHGYVRGLNAQQEEDNQDASN